MTMLEAVVCPGGAGVCFSREAAVGVRCVGALVAGFFRGANRSALDHGPLGAFFSVCCSSCALDGDRPRYKREDSGAGVGGRAMGLGWRNPKQ